MVNVASNSNKGTVMKPFFVLLSSLVMAGCGSETPEPAPGAPVTSPTSQEDLDGTIKVPEMPPASDQEHAVATIKKTEPAADVASTPPTPQEAAVAAIEKLGGGSNSTQNLVRSLRSGPSTRRSPMLGWNT